MGLDYNYILVIHKDQRDRLLRYVQEHGEVSGTGSFCLHFGVDSAVLKYLEGGYEPGPHYDWAEIQRSLLPGNKARIGTIDYSEEALDNHAELLRVRFMAVTSDMSRLLRDSKSVREWFVTLSKHVDAIITYMDMEAEGQRIIYGNDTETFLEFKEEGFSQGTKREFIRRMDEFAKYWPKELKQYETNYRWQEKISFIIRKEQRTALRKYVESHSRMDQDNLVLYFDLDAAIVKYLEDGYGETEYGIPHGSVLRFRREMVHKHIGENLKVALGNMDFVEEEIGGAEGDWLVHFIPRQWRMSRVFSESPSVRDWFRRLGDAVRAKLMFQSVWLGGYGHRIIYDQGQPTQVEFVGHYDLKADHFAKLYRVFAEYFEQFADDLNEQEG
ncbi:hypothetical protein [Paenibacillus sp. HW567]|uniref:hypothetical protein n=1 Tax=Paenibacillus sp. HW567 TaxID=1034769 RepID=UPI00037B81A0|nr:hypothetical protein [Paenibacillus sp. HW567]